MSHQIYKVTSPRAVRKIFHTSAKNWAHRIRRFKDAIINSHLLTFCLLFAGDLILVHKQRGHQFDLARSVLSVWTCPPLSGQEMPMINFRNWCELLVLPVLSSLIKLTNRSSYADCSSTFWSLLKSALSCNSSVQGSLDSDYLYCLFLRCIHLAPYKYLYTPVTQQI